MVQFQIGDHVLDGLGVLIGRSPSMMSICHNGALSKYDTFQGMVCALLGYVHTEFYWCGMDADSTSNSALITAVFSFLLILKEIPQVSLDTAEFIHDGSCSLLMQFPRENSVKKRL